MAGLPSILLLHFLALALELVLYGVYCVLFSCSVWVILRRRRDRANARAMHTAIDFLTWFIFATLTIHVVASCYARYEGLVVLGPQPASAIFYLINSSTAPGLIKAWTYGLSGIALEILLIYRVFIVWERAWAMVALPALLTLFNFAGFIMVVHVEATSGILGDGSPRVRTWSSVVFGLDALTNVICSVLLIWRIVRNSNGSMSSGGRGSLMPVLIIIAESAVIYTALTLLVVGGLVAEQAWVAVFVDVLPPIAGITSCLLTVRAGLDMAARSVYSVTASLPMTVRVAVAQHVDDGSADTLAHKDWGTREEC